MIAPVMLAMSCAAPEMLPDVAVMSMSPAPVAVATPPSTVTTAGAELVHVTIEVTSRDEPSWNLPVAVYVAITMPPVRSVTLCVAGATVMLTSPASVPVPGEPPPVPVVPVVPALPAAAVGVLVLMPAQPAATTTATATTDERELFTLVSARARRFP